MVGLFFKNVFRFLWYSIIVTAASVLLSWVICLFYEPMNVWYWYIAGVVGGVIVGFILCLFLSKRAAENDDDNYENERTLAVTLPLMFSLVFTAAAIMCLVLYKAELAAAILNEELHTDFGVLITALGVYSSFPLIFLVMMLSEYSEFKCGKCGHIFCISKKFDGSSQKEYYQFKTETNRERVGSIESGGTNIADVYGDVDTSYYRNVTETTTHYKCFCRVCGAKFRSTEVDTRHGEWK